MARGWKPDTRDHAKEVLKVVGDKDACRELKRVYIKSRVSQLVQPASEAMLAELFEEVGYKQIGSWFLELNSISQQPDRPAPRPPRCKRRPSLCFQMLPNVPGVRRIKSSRICVRNAVGNEFKRCPRMLPVACLIARRAAHAAASAQAPAKARAQAYVLMNRRR